MTETLCEFRYREMHSLRHSLAIMASYFFLVGAPGFWIPVLASVLEHQGLSRWIVWVFIIPPIAGFLSPLLIAAQADQRVAAQRVLAVVLLVGTVIQWFAFRELQLATRPWLFLFLFGLASLSLAPAFGLLNTITLVHLRGRPDRFGLYRVWGTIGWILAGLIVSELNIDRSPSVGYYTVGCQLIALGCCFALPNTLPVSTATVGWRNRIGLGAFQLLWRRDVGTVILCGGIFMMPLTAFYMHTSLFLNQLGFQKIASTMAIGQFAEIVVLLSLGQLITHVKPKTLFTAGILFGIARYVLFATGAMTNSAVAVVAGIALHGLCWTLYFEFARIYLDRTAPVEFRAQVQGLLVMSTSGIGSVCGTIAVNQLHQHWVGTAATSWAGFWLVLATICLWCGIGFFFFFRERDDRLGARTR